MFAPTRSGGAGTAGSTSTSAAMPCALPWRPLPSRRWSWPGATVWTGVGEVPLVVSNSLEKLSKTKDAVKLLKALHAYGDVEKAKLSRKIRPCKGKARNRRYVQRKGPLIIYSEDSGLTRAFRNLPGVTCCRWIG